MPPSSSFDVTTGVDLQEVDNAVNQAQKEIGQRYDFKGSKATIEFKRAGGDARARRRRRLQDARAVRRAADEADQARRAGEESRHRRDQAGRRRHGAQGDQAQDRARLATPRRRSPPRSRTRSSRKFRRRFRAIRCASRRRRRTIFRKRWRCCASKDFGVELKFGNYPLIGAGAGARWERVARLAGARARARSLAPST